MHTENNYERRGNGQRRPFRRRGNRHPGFAERDEPHAIPVPKGEIPEVFAGNAFGLLNPLIQHAVAEDGYLTPTPIQEKSIPVLLTGKDLLGCAQTGTGKTAAFLLPILHRLAANPRPLEPNHPRALILAPTRELAAQIAQCAADYGKFLGTPYAVVFGGVGQFPQVKALSRGAEVVIATPGRLFDLMEQKYAFLDKIEEFVLDEADRMLDMGFLPDIKKVIACLPQARHSQFFSATLTPEVMRLATSLVKDPEKIVISPDQPTVDRINQKLMFVEKANKCDLLSHLLTEHPEYEKVLVFARTRHGADKIVRKLEDADIRAAAIHSDKSQMQRTRVLEQFRKGRMRVLVATDIASRGIDVDNITHVFNFDLPEETESYVHRIGRTARAGASGAAISFVSAEERGLLRAVERMIKKSIDIDRNQPYHSEAAEAAASGKGGDGYSPSGYSRGRSGSSQRRERGERPHRPSNLGRRQSDFHKQLDNGNVQAPRESHSYHSPEREDTAPEASRDLPPRRKEKEPRFVPPEHVVEERAEKRREKEPWYAKPFRSSGHHMPGDPIREGRREDRHSSDEGESFRKREKNSGRGEKEGQGPRQGHAGHNGPRDDNQWHGEWEERPQGERPSFGKPGRFGGKPGRGGPGRRGGGFNKRFGGGPNNHRRNNRPR